MRARNGGPSFLTFPEYLSRCTIKVVTETLLPPDAHYFSAAEGWIALGNPGEALGELERISAENRSHPDVLGLRWHILAQSKKWEQCIEIGRELVVVAPERPTSWIWHAQAFYRLNRYQQAFDALRPALDKFPDDAFVIYDLACYHCLLGRIDQAKVLLDQALAMGGTDMKAHAISDPDLRPLWNDLQNTPSH